MPDMTCVACPVAYLAEEVYIVLHYRSVEVLNSSIVLRAETYVAASNVVR